jgi:hypothetical protein
MLYLSLIGSAILLLLAVIAVVRKGCPVMGFFAGGLAIVFLSFVIGAFLSALLLHFILLTVALLICHNFSRKPRHAVPLLLLASAIPYALASWRAIEEQREFARLREQYPLESMEERLPAPRVVMGADKLPPATEERLIRLEEDMRTQGSRGTIRTWKLQSLHENQVALFTNSPGFGVGRMLSRPDERGITSSLREEKTIPQPDSPPYPAELAEKPHIAREEALYGLHEFGVADFANVRGFGFVKDRKHVAGFQPHQFSELPSSEQWQVRRLDLVGLLLHDEPVAYVSEHLPRMDKVRDAPTRPLDKFESAALEGLRRGEDLLVSDTPDGLRMMGAIRSVKQCVSCHGGERGDLLGAFSYTLRRKER